MKKFKFDFISVAVGLSNASIVDPAALALSAEEMTQLSVDLSDFCQVHALTFDYPYCVSNHDWSVKLQPLKKVIGKPMSACLPQGQDSVKLNAILVEIQMFLKDHPINEKRRLNKQATVDTIWLQPKGFWF